ncbi:MAG: hypothetical protein M0Q13_15035 [Methanothrix sp.]|jgi:hypothetical protein|nr:hypothetical protein [Methanothrix sp.]
MRNIYVKDNFLIKAGYKTINEHDGIEKVYFILADGNVIFVDGTNIKENPSYKIFSNLKTEILKYGGICDCGALIVGKQSNDKSSWDFNCIECSYNITYSDHKLDDFVHDMLLKLENESKYY